MSAKMKVQKGDLVQVLAGKDRGKRGRVVDARPSERRVIVENLNLAKRHTKPRPMRDTSRMGGASIIPGGIIEKPMLIDVSNVMIVCPTCNEATRVGITIVEGKGGSSRRRVCKRDGCGEVLDR
jgi:large subunit ribosomal protein L24